PRRYRLPGRVGPWGSGTRTACSWVAPAHFSRAATCSTSSCNDRTAIQTEDPRLNDGAADSLCKFDDTESESLLFGRNFGVLRTFIRGRTPRSSRSRSLERGHLRGLQAQAQQSRQSQLKQAGFRAPDVVARGKHAPHGHRRRLHPVLAPGAAPDSGVDRPVEVQMLPEPNSDTSSTLPRALEHLRLAAQRPLVEELDPTERDREVGPRERLTLVRYRKYSR